MTAILPPCLPPSTSFRTQSMTRTSRQRTLRPTASGRRPQSYPWALASPSNGWPARSRQILRRMMPPLLSTSFASTSTTGLFRCQIAIPVPGGAVRWTSFWSACGGGERRWEILERFAGWKGMRGGLRFCISETLLDNLNKGQR